jgi:HSP20 family protein
MDNRGYECGPGFRGRRWGHERWFGNEQAPVNITESDSEYIIELFAPSLEKDKIQLTTQNDILTIKYTGNEQKDDKHFTRKEYHGDQIQRSFDLKGKVDADAINAKYSEGVLTVVLPKSASARKPAQRVSVE